MPGVKSRHEGKVDSTYLTPLPEAHMEDHTVSAVPQPEPMTGTLVAVQALAS